MLAPSNAFALRDEEREAVDQAVHVRLRLVVALTILELFEPRGCDQHQVCDVGEHLALLQLELGLHNTEATLDQARVLHNTSSRPFSTVSLDELTTSPFVVQTSGVAREKGVELAALTDGPSARSQSGVDESRSVA